MALLSILEYPDPRLRTVASEVLSDTVVIQTLIDDMLDTMYAAPGIGLAATQVNRHQRIITIDLSEERNSPHILINPTIKILNQESDNISEGCLSIPGFSEILHRPNRILVTSLNRNFTQISFEATGLLAVCIQHELDHLNGKLYIDHLSSIKRNEIKTEFVKAHKLQNSSQSL